MVKKNALRRANEWLALFHALLNPNSKRPTSLIHDVLVPQHGPQVKVLVSCEPAKNSMWELS